MKMTKILAILMIFILIGISFVAAQPNIYYNAADSQEMVQLQDRQQLFENRYNFDCDGRCEYENIGNGNIEVREERQIRIMNMISLRLRNAYEINENGELIKERSNIWSRLFNYNKDLQE